MSSQAKTYIVLKYEVPLDKSGEVIGEREVHLQAPSGISYLDIANLVGAGDSNLFLVRSDKSSRIITNFLDDLSKPIRSGSTLEIKKASNYRTIEDYLRRNGYPAPHQEDSHCFDGEVCNSKFSGEGLLLVFNNAKFVLPGFHGRVDRGEQITLYSIMGFNFHRSRSVADAASIEDKFSIITPGYEGKIWGKNFGEKF